VKITNPKRKTEKMMTQKTRIKFNDLIGKSKVTDVLPLLENVAKENGLQLNRVTDFKKARRLLIERYTIKHIA
jgi:hypothetical protein